MGNDHTFDPAAAESLEEIARYRYLSRDELVGALAPSSDDAILDLGSGTGFYTRDVAPFVDSVHAVDIQPEMHDHFRSAGLPENVDIVTAGVDDMPFDDAIFDAAYTTMTFHEFDTGQALEEIRRVLRPGARFVVVDWSQDGQGERGPPLQARVGPETAVDEIEEAGFEVEHSRGRPETFFVTAIRSV